jgi:hypothetical protein
MKNSDEQQQKELPTVNEMMKFLMTPGTVLGELNFPAKPIVFNNSSQQAVKILAVTIKSTETSNMAILHKLHTLTRA